jgi:hypothetical protein
VKLMFILVRHAAPFHFYYLQTKTLANLASAGSMIIRTNVFVSIL